MQMFGFGCLNELGCGLMASLHEVLSGRGVLVHFLGGFLSYVTHHLARVERLNKCYAVAFCCVPLEGPYSTNRAHPYLGLLYCELFRKKVFATNIVFKEDAGKANKENSCRFISYMTMQDVVITLKALKICLHFLG